MSGLQGAAGCAAPTQCAGSGAGLARECAYQPARLSLPSTAHATSRALCRTHPCQRLHGAHRPLHTSRNPSPHPPPFPLCFLQDKFLQFKYNAETVEAGKSYAKAQLQKEAGLPVDPKVRGVAACGCRGGTGGVGLHWGCTLLVQVAARRGMLRCTWPRAHARTPHRPACARRALIRRATCPPAGPRVRLHRPAGGAEGCGYPAGGHRQDPQGHQRAGEHSAGWLANLGAGGAGAGVESRAAACLRLQKGGMLHRHALFNDICSFRMFMSSQVVDRLAAHTRTKHTAASTSLPPHPLPPGASGPAPQIVILGTGKKALETQVKALGKTFPNMAAGIVKFSNPLAHLITAGADFMLVPSRFEPCGLIQLHAMQVRARAWCGVARRGVVCRGGVWLCCWTVAGARKQGCHFLGKPAVCPLALTYLQLTMRAFLCMPFPCGPQSPALLFPPTPSPCAPLIISTHSPPCCSTAPCPW